MLVGFALVVTCNVSVFQSLTGDEGFVEYASVKKLGGVTPL
jgi:hypothetical protein